jgi:hypothetical protein
MDAGPEGIPGQQYFAGTHLNPNVTWWEKSKPFFDYVNRCQAMLQQGISHADVLYYYGDHVPNFTQHRRKDPAKVRPGFDHDVISEEALLARTSVRDGRIVLPDGVSYRILVLPERDIISLPALRKVRELVSGGATVVGPRPRQASGLHNAASADAEVGRIAEELWGKGRVISGRSAREVLLEKGLAPDFEWQPAAGGRTDVDFIHRVAGGTRIYFVANLADAATSGRAVFRVAGLAPELWNPVTGERRFAAAYQADGGRVSVPLDFPPYGSWFVVFADPVAAHPPKGASNTPASRELAVLGGAWSVKFDPRWGGPATAEFPALVSWTERPEPGIKHYSGTAVYSKDFGMPEAVGGSRIRLDLGRVRELAEVRLNGKSCGIVWAPPFSVDVTGALKPGVNRLEIEVVNFWPNRIIGDAALPPAGRLTRTNVRKLTKDTALMPSGLLGPVSLLAVDPP